MNSFATKLSIFLTWSNKVTTETVILSIKSILGCSFFSDFEVMF